MGYCNTRGGEKNMNDAELLFFEKYPNALPLYEKLKERILDEIPGVQMKVQKTQISFINKHFLLVFRL